MGKWTVVVRDKFDAAHRIFGYEGKCSEWHGHTWKVEVGVEVDYLDELGMGVDFVELKKMLKGVLEKFDHAALVAARDWAEWRFGKYAVLTPNPTAEVIASEVYGRMRSELLNANKDVKLVFVRVWESDSAYVEYKE